MELFSLYLDLFEGQTLISIIISEREVLLIVFGFFYWITMTYQVINQALLYLLYFSLMSFYRCWVGIILLIVLMSQYMLSLCQAQSQTWSYIFWEEYIWVWVSEFLYPWDSYWMVSEQNSKSDYIHLSSSFHIFYYCWVHYFF